MKLIKLKYEKEEGFIDVFGPRRWETWIEIEYDNSSHLDVKPCIILGWNKYLTVFKGFSQSNWLVSSLGIGFALNPKTWKIASSHFFYDGPHCRWQFGPFVLWLERDGCKKCNGDR
jgi:hypothetical protein